MWGKKLSPKTWGEIDAAALRHNLGVFRELAGDARVMAIVKANAYGHGLLEVVKILSKPRLPSGQGHTLHTKRSLWFGVDNIDEALLIRGLNIKNPILILGYIPPERLKEAIEHEISFSVYSKESLKIITQKQWNKKPRIHLKIETGTNRLGMQPEELWKSCLAGRQADFLNINIEGVYTHFADTENPESLFWKEQVARFEEAITLLKKVDADPIRHIASSAAALLYPEACYDMMRAGIGLYGLYPSEDVRHLVLNTLKPVLSWKTRIVQIKQAKKGETIGYDRTFRAKRLSVIAILPVGYWDGYDRRFSNKGTVLIKGKRAPIAGNICMNIMMVDITEAKNAREGDEVVLLGKQQKEEIFAEELAEKIGTIHYEVVARINPLIARIVIHDI